MLRIRQRISAGREQFVWAVAIITVIAVACGTEDDTPDRTADAVGPAPSTQSDQSATPTQAEGGGPNGSTDDTAAAAPAESPAAAEGPAAQSDEPQSRDAEDEPARPAGPVQLNIVQVAVWGEAGDFDLPNHIDIGPDGNIYLTEFRGSRVFKFSPDGEELARWGGPGTEPGRLQAPTGIAVDADGFVYVGESGGSRVQKFTADGVWVATWGESGTADGQFVSAMGLDISADGRVYVADWGNGRVQVFTTDGVFLFNFGRPGTAPGEMVAPIGLDLDGDGNVLVVDSGNARVQKFSPEGDLLAVYNVGMSNPQVISARPEGGWYLSDPRAGRVAAYDDEGNQLAIFPLAIQYRNPHGTATGLDGAVYLADTGNNVVRKFLPASAAAAQPSAPASVPAPSEDPLLAVFPPRRDRARTTSPRPSTAATANPSTNPAGRRSGEHATASAILAGRGGRLADQVLAPQTVPPIS